MSHEAPFAYADEFSQFEPEPVRDEAPAEPMMTPAKRAALDALEREFRDLLKSAQS